MDKLIGVYRKFNSEEGTMYRRSLAFSIFLAIFPTVISMIIIFSLTYTSFSGFLAMLYQILPAELIQPLVNYVSLNDYGTGWTLIVTVLLTSNLASGSFYAFMLIAKRDEKFDYPNFLIQVKAFVVYILMLGVLNLIAWINIYHYIPTAIFNVVFPGVAFYFLFRSFSFEKQHWTYGLPGTIVTSSIIIGIVTLLFTYTNYVANYQNLYGPLSSILLGMLSIYYIASAIYLGYLVNAAFSKKAKDVRYKMIWYYSFGNYFFGLFNSFVTMITSKVGDKFHNKL